MRSRDKRLATLVTMHAYSRPAGSVAETLFRERWLLNLPGADEDRHGNIHVTIGADPIVLWSSHTDTVADMSGGQHVYLDSTGILQLRAPLLKGTCKSDRPVLGADDTAGVFIMREMILAGVPGRYVFHYGEEIGGIGSSALVREAPAWLDQIRMAIAFDRQGYHDVISSQFGSETCSDTFALALAHRLHAADPFLTYKPAVGIYTDTAEYAGLVAECTNLSVGYANAHSMAEVLDTNHVLRLLNAIIAVDVSSLPIDRTPEDPYAIVCWPDEAPSATINDAPQDYWHRPLVSPYMRQVCWYCGREFNADESNAASFTRYCDRDCEDEAERYDPSMYLDRVHADVQAALRRTH